MAVNIIRAFVYAPLVSCAAVVPYILLRRSTKKHALNENVPTVNIIRAFVYAPLVSCAVVVQYMLLRAAMSMSPGGVEETLFHHGAAPPLVNDGLVWITPKPNEARQVGWEDDWMMNWKRRHYSPSQSVGCNHTDDTPYDDGVMCAIPAYIPARLMPPTNKGPPPIPRVIFVSWLDRRLGRAMYTSLLTLLHHNPEYEMILFDDDDMDHFICENFGSSKDDFALPLFSKVQAGAMRADIWRLLVIRQYGGVYVDSDISALDKLPIEWEDTAVSGVGCWSHLPGKTGGLLEHWAMAFRPSHPYINEAVEAMTYNLQHPEFLSKKNTRAARREGSVTMRLTGPAMYQSTLHEILKKAKCKKEDNSFCPALFEPEKYCKDMDTFQSYFNDHRFFHNVNLNNAVSHKVFHPGTAWEAETSGFQPPYDAESVRMLEEPRLDFCDDKAFAKRAESREQLWAEKVENN